MNISILLPFKENYTHNDAGAVSLFVNDITRESAYKKSITVYGSTYYKKYLSSNYKNIRFNKNSFVKEELFLAILTILIFSIYSVLRNIYDKT